MDVEFEVGELVRLKPEVPGSYEATEGHVVDVEEDGNVLVEWQDGTRNQFTPNALEPLPQA
jgi:uncharacterized protein YodC (DUF2158 family)